MREESIADIKENLLERLCLNGHTRISAKVVPSGWALLWGIWEDLEAWINYCWHYGKCAWVTVFNKRARISAKTITSVRALLWETVIGGPWSLDNLPLTLWKALDWQCLYWHTKISPKSIPSVGILLFETVIRGPGTLNNLLLTLRKTCMNDGI